VKWVRDLACHVLCRMGGVGTWEFCYCMLFYVNIVDLQYHLMFVENYLYIIFIG